MLKTLQPYISLYQVGLSSYHYNFSASVLTRSIQLDLILTLALQGFLVGLFCLLAQNALANPTPTIPLTHEGDENFRDRPIVDIPSDSKKLRSNKLSVGTGAQIKMDSLQATPSEKTSTAENFERSCPAFTPITNAIAPNPSPLEGENTEKLASPTSACAADLKMIDAGTGGLGDAESDVLHSWFKLSSVAQTPSQDTLPEAVPDTSPSSSSESEPAEDSDEWHFKFQPYATIPVSTYGTATARGRTVNYSLSLGQLLQSLRLTASGRFEAWKGRWGFIIDGYYASLKGIINLQKSATRTPDALNALNYLLSKDVNDNAQAIAGILDGNLQDLKGIPALQGNQTIEDLKQKVQNFQAIAAQGSQNLQALDQTIQDFKETLAKEGQKLQLLDLKIEDVQELALNTQNLQDTIFQNVQDLPRIEDVPQLYAKVQESGKVPDSGQLKQALAQTRDSLEQADQAVKALRAQQDSEALEQLDAELQQTIASIDQGIEKIDNIQEFLNNRELQQLDLDSTSDLKFDQGIYDFAVSYHIGASPMYELPDKPSHRSYPLVWFEPIAGVRLNDINIKIQQTFDFTLSSSLVNFQGSFQETFQQGRTWFEPMLGGKLGVQVSDPLTFWVRGDVSGFGLAGDTDLSWNLFFGADWWVRRNLSLQLAYRFYSIDYSNGSGNNALGFTENFNGPFISATFHF